MRAQPQPQAISEPLAPHPRAELLRLLRLWIAALAAGLALSLPVGEPIVGFVPVLALAFLVTLWRAPLRVPALGLLFMALLLNSPKERPADGLWRSPLTVVGNLLYENLNNLTGISALRFAGIEVVLVVFVAAIVVRRAIGRPAGPPSPHRALGVNLFLALSLFAMLALEGMGLATGGDMKSSFWQIRELVWFPVLVWIFQAAELGPRDLLTMAVLVVVAALVKTAEGSWVYWVIGRALGIKPFYVTTHSDTQLFVTSILICLIGWLFWRSLGRWALLSLALFPLLGMVLNNRRLAFVALGANVVLLMVAFPKSKLKRSLTRATLMALPAIGLYLAVGWNSNAQVFVPAHMLSTLVSRKDASSETRDIENYNLIQTLRVHPIQGWGFGHPYLELSRAYDISDKFALYRYIGHNSVLWLWSIGGLFGFAAVWMPLVLAMFFAARSLLFSREPWQRAAALVGLTIPLTYMIQAYGDMGLQSWNGAFLVGATLAAMSRLAVALGAWPGFVPMARAALPGHAVAVEEPAPQVS